MDGLPAPSLFLPFLTMNNRMSGNHNHIGVDVTDLSKLNPMGTEDNVDLVQ
jgi:hypothetical protein